MAKGHPGNLLVNLPDVHTTDLPEGASVAGVPGMTITMDLPDDVDRAQAYVLELLGDK